MSTQREIRRFQTALAAEIKRTRISLGLSKTELSNRSGVSRQGIRLVEEGERNPSVVTVWQLSCGMGVPLTQILENVE